jgi:hypothetical protein
VDPVKRSASALTAALEERIAQILGALNDCADPECRDLIKWEIAPRVAASIEAAVRAAGATVPWNVLHGLGVRWSDAEVATNDQRVIDAALDALKRSP